MFKKPNTAGKATDENPYLSARREWTERYADHIRTAHGWRLVAVGAMATALAAVVGLGVVASQAKTVPYIVQVDKLGTVLPVARADQAARADTPIIRAQLAHWVTNIRSVYLDAAAEQRNVLAAYALLDQNAPAFQVVNEHMKTNDPFKRAQRESVSVEVQSVLPVGGDTWRVEWRETIRGRDGQVARQEQWSGVITTKINPPTDEATILVNPLGIYINAVSWSPRI
jgi:type IV secretion system protein VirB5